MPSKMPKCLSTVEYALLTLFIVAGTLYCLHEVFLYLQRMSGIDVSLVLDLASAFV